MSEIELKREARRRRILENSERRLLKITGRNNDCEADTKNASTEAITSQILFSATDQEENHSRRNINDIYTAKSNYERENLRTASSEMCNADDNWNDISPNLSSYKYEDTKCISENTRMALRRRLQPDGYTAYEETYTDHLTENSVSGGSTLSSSKSSLSKILLSSRINYVLLATVVNVLLVMRLDHLFGKTIAVPYLTMMLGRLLICKNTKETQNGSLLVAALILCNIKPELTYTLKKFVALFAMVLGDLVLYIFSFTLIYTGISYCFPNTSNQIITDSLTNDL